MAAPTIRPQARGAQVNNLRSAELVCYSSSVALTPERVRAFREDYRRERIAPGYRGWLHLGFITLVCLGAMVAALVSIDSIRALSWFDWLVIPIAWITANAVEYAMHRGPMHHLGALTAKLYKRHTSEHHRFFSREVMAIDSARDFQATLFPPWMSLVFVGLIGAPMALLVGWVFGHDTALLFYAAIVFYYLTFEWMHLGIHMPEDGLIARLPLVGWARHHHGLHHDPARMRRANFNFAFPLCDWLFGTLER